MKVMIIGGRTDDGINWEKIKEYCITIGRLLYKYNHTVELCSPFEDSADYWVLQGYIDSAKKETIVSVRYVGTKEVENQINKIQRGNLKINKIPIIINGKEIPNNLSYLWLLCQLETMESVQCVIAIGGKSEGSASMLLRFAEGKRKLVLPCAFSLGAAAQAYERREYQLRDRFADRIRGLNNAYYLEEIISEIEDNVVSTRSDFCDKKVFISYARKRPAEADLVETILRRRNITVYRDESDFGAGDDIPARIEENIYKSNIFIAVYCAEYACSPWCYDELELALDLKEKGTMDIWILCVDDTRVVSKRARNMMYYLVNSREEIEGRILALIGK